MSKFTKAVLSISAACMVMGLVLSCVGFASGGAAPIALGWRDGRRVMIPLTYHMEEKTSDFAADKVDSLSVDADACTIRIVEGSKLSVSVSYDPEIWEYNTELNSGTLSVVLHPYTGFIGVNPLFNYSADRAAAIVITVPDDFEFDQVYVDADGLRIELGTLICKNLDLSFSAADVSSDNLVCETINLKVDAGYITLDSVTATQSAVIDLTAGSINFSNSNLHDMSFKMNAGNMEYSGKLSGNNSIKVTAGRANFNLTQPSSDFGFSCMADAGSITINDQSFSGLNASGSTGSGKIKVDIKLEAGSVNVTTR